MGTFSFSVGKPAAFETGGVLSSDSLSAIAAYLATAVIEDVTGTTYTVLLADNGKIKRFTNGSAITVTLPSSFVQGFNIGWIQSGAGQITFAAASGGTLANLSSQSKSGGAKAVGGLFVEANSDNISAAWVLSGATGA